MASDTDGGIDVDDAVTVVAQIQRTVTVFQANEMIVLDEERNWLLRQILIAQSGGDFGGRLFDGGGFTDGSEDGMGVRGLDGIDGGQTNNFDINVETHTSLTYSDIEELLVLLDLVIRKFVFVNQ